MWPPLKALDPHRCWFQPPFRLRDTTSEMIFWLLFTTYSIVRLTSPNLNYYIIVGSLCLYGSIYIRIYPASSELFTHARCNVSVHITAKCRRHSLETCHTDVCWLFYSTIHRFRIYLAALVMSCALHQCLSKCGGCTTFFIILHHARRWEDIFIIHQ